MVASPAAASAGAVEAAVPVPGEKRPAQAGKAARAATAAPRAPAMSRSGTSENSATSSCSARSCVLRAHHRQVPVAELRRGLDHTAADEVAVGVGEVGRDREQPSDRDRLLLEDLASHLVAAFAVAAQLLRGLVDRHAAPIRDRDSGSASRAAGCGGCRSARRCSRHRRRTRSCSSAAADRRPSSPCIGMCTWPSSPAIPAAPRTTAPHSITPPPRPVPTMAETDERPQRTLAEVRVVGVQRGSVAVVGVDDRDTEPGLERAAHVEAPPLRQREVGGTLRRDHPFGRRRPGCVEAHGANVRRDRLPVTPSAVSNANAKRVESQRRSPP